MAAPNPPGSNIKIGIPHLTFEGVSDLADKQRLVTSWKNKLVLYTKFHKIYVNMLTPVFSPQHPVLVRANDRAEYDLLRAGDPGYVAMTNADKNRMLVDHQRNWQLYDEAMAAFETCQQQCLAVLSESLDTELGLLYLDSNSTKTAYEIINQITNQYCRVDNVTKAMINDEYDRLSMDGSFDEYCEHLTNLCNRLAGVGTVISDVQKIMKMMNALFTSRRSIWFQSQAAINADINTLTFDEAKGKVESYIQLHESGQRRYGVKKRKVLGIRVRDSKNYNGSTRYDTSNMKCYNCNKIGHISRDCREPPKNKKKQTKYSFKNDKRKLKKQIQSIMKSIREEESDSDVREEEEEPKKKIKSKPSGSKVKINVIIKRRRSPIPVHSVRRLNGPSMFNEADNPDVILDSGASTTVFTKVHPLMKDIQTNIRTELVFAGGEVGGVDATASLGDMKDIHCSSVLAHECLSVSQLTAMGYTVVFDSEHAYILKPYSDFDIKANDILMKAVNVDGLYKLPLHDVVSNLIEDSD